MNCVDAVMLLAAIAMTSLFVLTIVILRDARSVPFALWLNHRALRFCRPAKPSGIPSPLQGALPPSLVQYRRGYRSGSIFLESLTKSNRFDSASIQAKRQVANNLKNALFCLQNIFDR
jgi:hypothetical protein